MPRGEVWEIDHKYEAKKRKSSQEESSPSAAFIAQQTNKIC